MRKNKLEFFTKYSFRFQNHSLKSLWRTKVACNRKKDSQTFGQSLKLTRLFRTKYEKNSIFLQRFLNSVICYLLSVICHLSTVNCKLYLINVICQMSSVICQMSSVKCHLSNVICQVSSVKVICQSHLVVCQSHLSSVKVICHLYTIFSSQYISRLLQFHFSRIYIKSSFSFP